MEEPSCVHTYLYTFLRAMKGYDGAYSSVNPDKIKIVCIPHTEFRRALKSYCRGSEMACDLDERDISDLLRDIGVGIIYYQLDNGTYAETGPLYHISVDKVYEALEEMMPGG